MSSQASEGELHEALQTIVSRVVPGATLEGFNRLSGGLSYQLRKVRYLSGHTRGALVLREASNMRAGRWGLPLKEEFALLSDLQHTSLPVPKMLHFDDSGDVLRHPFAVYEFIEGQPLLRASDPRTVGEAVAQRMAEIHNTNIDASEGSSVDGPAINVSALPQWSQFVGGLLAEPPPVFDESIDEATIWAALDRHWPPADPAQMCLLHGDLWPGNLIERNGELVGILDWENASVGDPLADVAITRLDLLWCFGVTATLAFTQKYVALRTVDPAGLPVWDLFAALRPAGDLHHWAAGYPGLGRPDITFETMQAGHRWFVAQALAAL